jgi:hypothetical protein
MAKSGISRFFLGMLALLAMSSLGILTGCKEEVRKFECSPKAFKAAMTEEDKRKALEDLLEQQTPECFSVYFELAGSADQKDRPVFKATFRRNISCSQLKGLTAFLMESIRGEMAEADVIYKRFSIIEELSEADKSVLRRISQSSEKKMDARLASIDWLMDVDEMKAAVRRNVACLAKDAREQFSSEGLGGKMRAVLTASTLVNAGESGFEAVLGTGLSTKEDLLFVSMTLESFDGHAVFPLLKFCEREPRKDVQKNAGMLLLMLSDTEAVYQRVIDAVNHGFFYPTELDGAKTIVITDEEGKKKPGKKGEVRLSLGDVLNRATHGCRFLLDSKYEGKTAFALYLSAHMPKKPRAQLIKLFIKADARIAAEYFMGKDPATMSDDTLMRIRSELFKSGALPDVIRQRLYEHIFKGLPPGSEGRMVARALEPGVGDAQRITVRESMLYGLSEFPEEFQRTFIAENFRSMTPEEKGTAIFMLGKLPLPEKRKGFGAIRPFCSVKERGMAEYYLRKPSTDI